MACTAEASKVSKVEGWPPGGNRDAMIHHYGQAGAPFLLAKRTERMVSKVLLPEPAPSGCIAPRRGGGARVTRADALAKGQSFFGHGFPHAVPQPFFSSGAPFPVAVGQ
jgi:hypothetical protein